MQKLTDHEGLSTTWSIYDTTPMRKAQGEGQEGRGQETEDGEICGNHLLEMRGTFPP